MRWLIRKGTEVLMVSGGEKVFGSIGEKSKERKKRQNEKNSVESS